MASEGAYWRVRGARRDSGRDIEVLLRAGDPASAEAEASRLGILTSAVEPVAGVDAARAGAGGDGRAGAGRGTERLVRIYATRPRDHLYIGWLLRHRRRLIVTTHRVVLHRRTLLSSFTATLDVGAVNGVVIGRVTRWRVLVGVALLLLVGVQMLPLLWMGNDWQIFAAGATLVALGLIFSRADFLGVVSESGRLGLIRYGVRREVGESFLRDVHSVLRPGMNESLIPRMLARDVHDGEGACPSCGYPLTGLEGASVCPECGARMGAGAAG